MNIVQSESSKLIQNYLSILPQFIWFEGVVGVDSQL